MRSLLLALPLVLLASTAGAQPPGGQPLQPGSQPMQPGMQPAPPPQAQPAPGYGYGYGQPQPQAQQSTYDAYAQISLDQTYARMHRKRTGGLIVLILGAAMTAGGIAMIAAGLNSGGCTTSSSDTDCGKTLGLVYGGLLLALTGPSLLITGIVLVANANRRLRDLDMMYNHALRWEPQLAVHPEGGLSFGLLRRF